MASGGGGAKVPECIFEQVVADLLGLTPLELRELDTETAYSYLGYAEGKAVAQWARDHQPPAGNEN